MSSSDSDDDCYGNVAKRLQKMKNRFVDDKVETQNVLNESAEIDKLIQESKSIIAELSSPKQDLPACLPEASGSGLSSLPEITIPGTGRTTRSTRKSNATTEKSAEPATKRAKKAKTPKKKTPKAKTPKRRSRRGRWGGWRKSSWPAEWRSVFDSDYDEDEETMPPPTAPLSRTRPCPTNDIYPTYSIGNTYEYPDQCESQQLFSSKPSKPTEVIEVAEADPLDLNEELSVKVHWQSSEYFRFSIKRFNKLKPIFDYFSDKEKVEQKHLLLLYNDKIISATDTPDSIKYSVAKFIDGGIVSKNVQELTQKNPEHVKNAIKIKFQCQNMKKRFELAVNKHEPFKEAMEKCAEHFQLKLDSLKFIFDGDVINGKNTPEELDFEGGECVDVNLLC